MKQAELTAEGNSQNHFIKFNTPYRMKKIYLLVINLLVSLGLFAQVSTLPVFPSPETPITIIYDATKGVSGLNGADKVYLHSGVVLAGPEDTEWTNVVGNWGADDGIGEMNPVPGEADKWQITLTPRTYYGVDPSQTLFRLGMVFRNADGSKTGKSDSDSDIYINLSSGEVEVAFTTPVQELVFVDSDGDIIQVNATASTTASLSLLLDGEEIVTNEGMRIESSIDPSRLDQGLHTVSVKASIGGEEVARDEFRIIIRAETVRAPLPTGIIRQGVTYDKGNPTEATLVFKAPLKNSIYVIGDFNDWEVNPEYRMKQDGDLFWIKLKDLDPSVEYAYQYLVDEELKVADTYAEKVLDPDNDRFIDDVTYPGLRPYPDNAAADGIVSVLQTAQTEYPWEVDDFTAPKNEDLIIYELLLRDFDERHSYTALIERLDYLENLGINAIELMPIKEFDNNDSWGYNPAFFFATDKYYGPKKELKAFIDECHKRGIAVIMDLVLNHTHEDNPIAQMYWDQANFRPAPDNPWLNSVAKHPFNVFFDFNHESEHTQTFVDDVNRFWLEEFRIDGIRFDLTKGFTQKNSCTSSDCSSSSEVGNWNTYDQSRVDILMRMANEVWDYKPDSYVIFEHLGRNDEEKVMADQGVMFWGNMEFNYAQLAMGYAESSNLEWALYKERDWESPHLISYMESHDEERIPYKVRQFGNASGTYNTRQLATALDRMKATATFYYTVPGPKMLWQFGELGYDISINENGRVGRKPIPWQEAADGLGYDSDPDRQRLYETFAALMSLKNNYDLFGSDHLFEWTTGEELVRTIRLTNIAGSSTPSSADEMNAYIIANFDVVPQNLEANFQHTGKWYRYFANGEVLEVEDTQRELSLQPGEFRVYTDFPIPPAKTGLIPYVAPYAPKLEATPLNDREIALTWESLSSDVERFDIVVFEGGSSGSEPILEVSLGPDETDFILSEVSSGPYTILLRASNDYGTTDATPVTVTVPVEAVVPNPPGNLTLEVNGGSILLTWEHDGSVARGFAIERSIGGESAPFELIAEVAAATLAYEDKNITSGLAYAYRLRSFNGTAFSAYSNITTERFTGLKINDFEKNFTLYPNPTTALMTLEAEEKGKPIELLLYSTHGRTVAVPWTDVGRGSYTLDLSELAKGVYFLSIFHGRTQYMTRIIKH